MNKRTQNILERIEGWPEEAQAEVVDLIDKIEIDFLNRIELSDDDISALTESENDVRHNRYENDEDMTALFQRYRSA